MSKVNSAISGAATGASIGGPWGAAIGGVGGMLLGQEDDSQDYLKRLAQQAQNIPLPELQKMIAEQYSSVGQLNPELESVINLGPSAMEGISTDPALRQAQMSALMKLQGISDAGGQDAQFMSDNQRLQNDINSNLQGNQQAIQQDLAARGLSGGMSEMVQRQMAAQQASNRQAQLGVDMNAQAQQRALAALTQGAQLGGQMENQQFNQQSQIAQAKDLANKFDVQNRQSIQGSNIDRKNTAQVTNLGNQQNIANQNVAARQGANEYNLNIPQQQFNNQLSKYGQIANVQTNLAANRARQAEQQDEFLGGTFETAAKAYGTKGTKGK